MEESNIATEDMTYDQIFAKIDSEFPDTSFEHIVNNPNFKIESSLKYKGNSTIFLKTKSVIKNEDMTRIEREFRIQLDDDSSFYYDDVSKCYIRKNNVNKEETLKLNGMKPERFNTCNDVNTIDLFKNSDKKVTFSTIKTEFEFSVIRNDVSI